MAEPEVVDGDVIQEMEAPAAVIDGETQPVDERPSTRRRKPRAAAPRSTGARKTADAPAAPRARKTTTRPRPARRPRKDTPSE